MSALWLWVAFTIGVFAGIAIVALCSCVSDDR